MAINANTSDVVATSTITKKINVVLQNVKEMEYPYELKDKSGKTTKAGKYYRMFASFGDLDSTSMFGSQLIFLMNQKEDSAYASVKKSAQGDRGVLTVEFRTAIIKSGITEEGLERFRKETVMSVLDFAKEEH